MPRTLAVALLLAVACASTPHPFRPSISVEQLNPMYFTVSTVAPVGLEVRITNTSSEPLTVRRVRIEGAFTQQYQVRAMERPVLEVIAPGETKAIALSITATSQQGMISDPEPLNLRGFISYTVGEKQFEDFYLFRPILQR